MSNHVGAAPAARHVVEVRNGRAADQVAEARPEARSKTPTLIAGAVATTAIVGGLALRHMNIVPRVGSIVAALGMAGVASALLSACELLPENTGGLPKRGSDTTKPPPADWKPSGARQSREGVVQVIQQGGTLAGSGWVPAPGRVVTNHHVVSGMRHGINVRDQHGAVRPARLMAVDELHDLALLKVDGLPDRPLPMDDVVDYAERAEATGYPNGAFSAARMVAIRYVDAQNSRGARQVLHFDGTYAPGGSGSALINGSGEVVGTAFAVGARIDTKTGKRTPNVLAVENDHVRRLVRSNPG